MPELIKKISIVLILILYLYPGIKAQDVFVDFGKPIGNDLGKRFIYNGGGNNCLYQTASLVLNYIDKRLKSSDLVTDTILLNIDKEYTAENINSIFSGSHRNAVQNVLDIYSDMPIERKSIKFKNYDIMGIASSNQKKASLVLWNNSEDIQKIYIKFSHIPFEHGSFSLFRIDKTHASYYDGTNEELISCQSNNDISMSDLSWSGNLPANAVIYIAIYNDKVSMSKLSTKENVLINSKGIGLKAEYFDDIVLKDLKFSRMDSVIDFNWTHTAPAPSIRKDSFSVRWTGELVPLYSEKYTFYLTSNNGRRLWINDSLIIDKRSNDWDIEHNAEFYLTAGNKYKIKLEYFERHPIPYIKLEWSSIDQRRQVIPSMFLYAP